VAEHFQPGRRDSRLLWAPQANHGVAIADLDEPDRAAAVALLTRWAGLSEAVSA
jgi:hypothetical protein